MNTNDEIKVVNETTTDIPESEVIATKPLTKKEKIQLIIMVATIPVIITAIIFGIVSIFGVRAIEEEENAAEETTEVVRTMAFVPIETENDIFEETTYVEAEAVSETEIVETEAVTEPEIIEEAVEEAIYISEPLPSTQDEVEMLACVIYQEAGSEATSDLTRRRVADVVLNRIEDPRFPNTMYEVLTAPCQYGLYSVTGIIWPERASNPNEAASIENCYRIAEEVLAGNHSDLYGNGYVWQAEFVQGVDNIYADGTYFGR